MAYYLIILYTNSENGLTKRKKKTLISEPCIFNCGKQTKMYVKEFNCKIESEREREDSYTNRDARVNLSEVIETSAGCFSGECCPSSPIILFLSPVVSRKPFLMKGLADEGLVAWLLFRLFWVKDLKGAWGLPLLAQLLTSCIYLNI